jgi:mannose-1-phosphate guanylyltransferase
LVKNLSISQAFVLGAGLGTRLRPLTDELPKPLVPIFQKPLITFAFDHLLAAGCERILVNTHHQPQAFAAAFPSGAYRGHEIEFHHEPVLLETAGGIANVGNSLGEKPFLVYNADVLTDLPLEPLIEEHFRAGNLVTLALRSGEGPRHVAFDRAGGRVRDIRNLAGSGQPDEFVFTGIYAVDPAFLSWLERGVKRSVIPIFIELIRRGEKLGGVVIDDGHWWDVGTREAYLQLHRELPRLSFPPYEVDDLNWRTSRHPTAVIESGAQLRGCSVAGAGARVGAGAILDDTILWPDAQVASQSALRNCIVRQGRSAEGALTGADI